MTTTRTTPSPRPPRTPHSHSHSHSYRTATVYDVVAGQFSSSGFHGGGNPIGPDEALGRRTRAPKHGIPYEDKPGLPSSDLLRAIHQYATDFYARNGMDGLASRAMDESALLAMGMLLEEEVREAMGGWRGGGEGTFVDEEEFRKTVLGQEERGEEDGDEDEDEGDGVHGDVDGQRENESDGSAIVQPTPLSSKKRKPRRKKTREKKERSNKRRKKGEKPQESTTDGG